MKTAILALILAFAACVPGHAQTDPTITVTTSIANAVASGCAGAPGRWNVIIPSGATPTDTIASAIGCQRTYITDQRQTPVATCQWTAPAYICTTGPQPPSGGGAVSLTTTLNTTYTAVHGPGVFGVFDPNIVASNQELTSTLGIVPRRASVPNKTIVIYGSSTGQGALASTYANSWGGLFTAAMSAKGYSVVNSSVSGNGSTALVGRFYTDVAPFRPGFVILCVNYANDSYNMPLYKANTLQLIQMVRQIGAIPVLIPQYGNDYYTAQQYQDVQDVQRQFVALGVPTFDWQAQTANPANNGHYYTGYDADAGLHMNDVGQLAAFNAIPLTMFDALLTPTTTPIYYDNKIHTAWNLPATTGAVPVTVTLDRPATSFTFAAWIYMPTTSTTVVYMNFTGTGDAGNSSSYTQLRLRSPSGNAYSLAAGGTQYVQASATTGWVHVTVTYNGATNTYAMYQNGALVGTGVSSNTATTVTSFSLFNNSYNPTFPAVGASFSTTYFYRVPLTASQVAALYNGAIPLGGMEWASRFDTTVSASSSVAPTLVNIALSTTSSSTTAGTVTSIAGTQ